LENLWAQNIGKPLLSNRRSDADTLQQLPLVWSTQ
jgi:hypothetical protein